MKKIVFKIILRILKKYYQGGRLLIGDEKEGWITYTFENPLTK